MYYIFPPAGVAAGFDAADYGRRSWLEWVP
jgi:hypothetical protein